MVEELEKECCKCTWHKVLDMFSVENATCSGRLCLSEKMGRE